MTGGELFAKIVELEKYSEEQAKDLMKNFLTTLALIHEKGIVHRDLKVKLGGAFDFVSILVAREFVAEIEGR